MTSLILKGFYCFTYCMKVGYSQDDSVRDLLLVFFLLVFFFFLGLYRTDTPLYYSGISTNSDTFL